MQGYEIESLWRQYKTWYILFYVRRSFEKSNFISEWNKQSDAMHMIGMYEIHLEILFR